MNDTFDEQSDAIFRQKLADLSLQDVLDMLKGDRFRNKIVDVREHPIDLDINMLYDPMVIISTNTQMSPPITYVIYKDICGNTTGNRIEFLEGGWCIHYKFDGTTDVDAEDTELTVDKKTIDMLDDMCIYTHAQKHTNK